MDNCLINLENFSYEDYLEAKEFMNEAFIMEGSQSYEIEHLLKRLSEVNSNLKNKNIEKLDKDEIDKLLEDLERASSNVSKKNINTYTFINTITKVVEFVDYIMTFYDIFTSVKGMIQDTKKLNTQKVTDALNKLSPKEINELNGNKEKLKEFVKKTTKDNLPFKTKLAYKAVPKVIDMITDFFSIKTLVSKAVNILNSYLGNWSKTMLSYEKGMDKGYELLLSCEAKMMIKKRKAKETNDKELEASCDKVIELVENLKKERVKAKELERRAKNESAILESERTEFNVNTFKLVCRDIAEALKTEKENLKVYTDAALFLVKRALEVTDKNKDSKFKLMESKIQEAHKFAKDINRAYDRNSINALLHKYSNLFSTKYSKFGFRVREDFENTLQKYAKDMLTIMNNYGKELISTLSIKEKTINMNLVLMYLEDQCKCSRTIFNQIKRMIMEIQDEAEITFDITNEYIKWCKATINVNKDSLKFKILHKLFG